MTSLNEAEYNLDDFEFWNSISYLPSRTNDEPLINAHALTTAYEQSQSYSGNSPYITHPPWTGSNARFQESSMVSNQVVQTDSRGYPLASTAGTYHKPGNGLLPTSIWSNPPDGYRQPGNAQGNSSLPCGQENLFGALNFAPNQAYGGQRPTNGEVPPLELLEKRPPYVLGDPESYAQIPRGPSDI